MNMTKEDMIELRKQMAISQNKSKYGYLNTGDIAQKKYKMRKDPLSKENRKRIDDIKDKLNGEHVESDLW